MSNHSASYMLNAVLHLLERRGVFDHLGKQQSQELVLEIIHLSDRYDCNPGEILDEIDQRLGICSYCLTVQPGLVDGFCTTCRAEFG